MPDIVESDGAVDARASGYVSTVLNASGGLAKLFTNPSSVTPANVAGDFTEATYTGYAAQTTVGIWSSPVQIVAGQWASTSAVIDFPGSTGGSPETIYGIYIVDGFGALLMSWTFSSSIIMSPGDPDILAQATYNFWARVLLP